MVKGTQDYNTAEASKRARGKERKRRASGLAKGREERGGE